MTTFKLSSIFLKNILILDQLKLIKNSKKTRKFEQYGSSQTPFWKSQGIYFVLFYYYYLKLWLQGLRREISFNSFQSFKCIQFKSKICIHQLKGPALPVEKIFQKIIGEKIVFFFNLCHHRLPMSVRKKCQPIRSSRFGWPGYREHLY